MDEQSSLDEGENPQQSTSQYSTLRDDASDLSALNPENLSSPTATAKSFNESSHIDPSMLKALVPTKTRFCPVTTKPYWSLIEYPVKEAILKIISDDLKSFQQACYKLELFSNEVREILERRKKLHPTSFLLKEELLAYGCKYLESRDLEEYLDLLKKYGRRAKYWPLDINLSDLQLDDLPKSMKYVEPTVRFFPHVYQGSQAGELQNSATGCAFSLSTDSIAISASIIKTVSGRFFSTIDSFRLPAGVVVISPKGTKQLAESGTYTIINPPFPAFTEAHQFIICNNAVTCSMAPMANFPGSQNPTLGRKELLPSPILYSKDGSDSRSNVNSKKSFFDDMISDRTGVIDRALADNLLPHDPPGDDDRPAQFISDLLLQPRKDATCLVFGTEDEITRDLTLNGYSALLHMYLPEGYSVVSPSGYRMNFDTPHMSEKDGKSPPGSGGEYIVVPLDHAVHANNYRAVRRAKSDVAWVKFDEPMVVFRDGKMLPRFVGTGLHRLFTRNGELIVSCAGGEYDLAKALRNPDPHPLFTVKSIPIDDHEIALGESAASSSTRTYIGEYIVQDEEKEIKEEDKKNSYYGPPGPSCPTASALMATLQDRKRKPTDDVIKLPQKAPRPGLPIRPLVQSETQPLTQEKKGLQVIKPKPLLEPQVQDHREPKIKQENKPQLLARLKTRPMAKKQPRFPGLTAENAPGLIGSAPLQQSTIAAQPVAATQGGPLSHPQEEAKAQPEVKKKNVVRIVLTNKKTAAAPATPAGQSGLVQGPNAPPQQTPTVNPQAQVQAQAQTQTQQPAAPQPGPRRRGRPRKIVATPAEPRNEQSVGASGTPAAGGAVLSIAPQPQRQTGTSSSETNPGRRTSVRGRRSSRQSGGQEDSST
ncbi:hypothetical protein Daesc_000710 [Daldinia eschscholtzii]|uniref:Uncharacterized protein n=1 Tax=Daldinia eschscholtzii TaxID=292717 RepID=A0AAX6MZ30_9PEZI